MLSDFFDKRHISISSKLNELGLFPQLFVEIITIYIEVKIKEQLNRELQWK